MDLNLNDAEITVLKRRLLTDFGNLRMEVARTESFELREQLKRDEAILRLILERLGVQAAELSQPSAA